KKNVVVGTYTVWRIARDAEALQRFLETIRDNKGAEIRIADLVISELGATLGAHPFTALVTTQSDEWRWRDLVSGIAARCRDKARDDFGIEIVDFQLQRLSFPEQNRRSVFERMRSERERIAARYRSEGDTEARRIRAEADQAAGRIRAEADEQHLRIVGEADAGAARIYAEAYGRDPEFYEFIRSLDTFGKAFDEKTVAIFSAASRFLRPLIEFGELSDDLDLEPAPTPAASRPVVRQPSVEAAIGSE
ncbi:MAG: protease modulator HflC, partial [Phycisphaerae bacterium]